MPVEGTLDVFQLPEILQMISRQHRTGILTVQGESDIVAISFAEGRVVGADALNRTVEDGLWEVLHDLGTLDRARFDAAVAEHHRAGKRLIDVLVERGYLERGELLAAIRLQTFRLLADLLSWRVGEFKFYRGEEVSHEEGFPPIPVEEVLFRAMEEGSIDSDGTPLPRPDSVFRAVVPASSLVEAEDDEAPSMPVPAADGTVAVSSTDRAVFDRLNGRFAAEAVVRQTGLDPYQVRYALYRLHRAGIVEPVEKEEVTSTSIEAPAAEETSPRIVEPTPSPPLRRDERPPPKPRPAPVVVREQTVVTRVRGAPARQPWIATGVFAGLAFVLSVVCVAAIAVAPESLLASLPWQGLSRSAYIAARNEAVAAEVQKAAKTFYLLEGRFPADLDRLVELGLLSRTALFDIQGRKAVYQPGEESYRLAWSAQAEGEAGEVTSIRGNFLLDPESLATGSDSGMPPLVLLD